MQLRDAGYIVSEATDGREALQIIEKDQDLQLLLSDVSMPNGMSGLDLARQAVVLQPTLSVLLTSGYSEVLRSDDHGFELLPKPYSAKDLVKRVSDALSAKRMGSSV